MLRKKERIVSDKISKNEKNAKTNKNCKNTFIKFLEAIS